MRKLLCLLLLIGLTAGCKASAKVSEQMCIGELEQLETLNTEFSEESYFRMIEKKTALFIPL